MNKHAVVEASTALEASNTLADLAVRIVAEHTAIRGLVADTVIRAMTAGDLLLEAKVKLGKHGQWLPWLRDHCTISERTAQLYMRLAKHREVIEGQMKCATGVADFTLNEAAAMLVRERVPLASEDYDAKVKAYEASERKLNKPPKPPLQCIDRCVDAVHDRIQRTLFVELGGLPPNLPPTPAEIDHMFEHLATSRAQVELLFKRLADRVEFIRNFTFGAFGETKRRRRRTPNAAKPKGAA